MNNKSYGVIVVCEFHKMKLVRIFFISSFRRNTGRYSLEWCLRSILQDIPLSGE
jgi:hypothetical protein